MVIKFCRLLRFTDYLIDYVCALKLSLPHCISPLNTWKQWMATTDTNNTGDQCASLAFNLCHIKEFVFKLPVNKRVQLFPLTLTLTKSSTNNNRPTYPHHSILYQIQLAPRLPTVNEHRKQLEINYIFGQPLVPHQTPPNSPSSNTALLEDSYIPFMTLHIFPCTPCSHNFNHKPFRQTKY